MEDFFRQEKYSSLAKQMIEHLHAQNSQTSKNSLGKSIERDNECLKAISPLSLLRRSEELDKNGQTDSLGSEGKKNNEIFRLDCDADLLSKVNYLKTHRVGISGKIANYVLHKLYLATSTFFSSVFGHQESINTSILEKVNELIAQLNELKTDMHKFSVNSNDYNSRVVGLQSALKEADHSIRVLEHSFREEDKAREEQIKALNGWNEQLNKEIHGVTNWLENTRKEFFAEIKFAEGKNISEQTIQSREPIIINPSKIQDLHPIKLNLGCGLLVFDQYINIDVRELPGVDVVATVDNLPFAKGTVEEIFAAHLIEHFEEDEFVGKLLPYWSSLLSRGGKVRFIFPDEQAMIAAYQKGDVTWAVFREITLGGQDYAGNYHFNIFTFDYLKELLTTVGFSRVTLVASARRNGQCLEMEIEAYRDR